MDSQALYRLSETLPKLALVLPILGGVVAAIRLTRPSVASRSDRATAVRLALVLAIIAAAGGGLLIAAVAGMFGDGLQLGVGAAWGLAIGALVFGSALFGYALFAWPRIGKRALLGGLIAPFVLVGGPLLAADQVRMLASRTMQAELRADQDARSTFLHATASIVSVTRRGTAGTPDRVRLAVSVRSDRPFELANNAGGTYPVFELTRGTPGWSMVADPPAGSPSRYSAGVEARYDVVLEYYGPAAELAGDWSLELTIQGLDPVGMYVTRTPLHIDPPG